MFYATGIPGWAYFGHPAFSPVSGNAADEREILNKQAELLERQLKEIKEQLSNLNEKER